MEGSPKNCMFRCERKIGRETLIIEWGKFAHRARSSTTVTYGDTVVFAAVTSSPGAEGVGFTQLYVDYREYYYASGKIPGGFFKREGKPSTKEVLTSRLIDRSLRPLFPKGFSDEVSVVSHVLSADDKYDPSVLAIIASAAALATASLPIATPVGAVCVGMDAEQKDFILFPTYDETEEGSLELIVAGSKDSVSMVECGAKEVPEEKMVEAILFAQEPIRQIVEMIEEGIQALGAPIPEFTAEKSEPEEQLFEDMWNNWHSRLKECLLLSHKPERDAKLKELKEELVTRYTEGVDELELAEREQLVKHVLEDVVDKTIRQMAIEGRRVGDRGLEEIRPISIEVGLYPRTHGSAMFQRGETVALVFTTLGTIMDEQRVDSLTDDYTQKFMVHYNFPSFSVGETWPNRGPKRREIGHGALAERALSAVLPDFDDFPYTVRIVSDIMSSNGSSSMATVCGGTLSLMDAGVPIRSTVAGVAMGLIKDGDTVYILSDIAGEEDHAGDMDFKVAGTRKGITALQMDIKISGVTREIIEKALQKAREGRLFILDKIEEVISEPRPQVSKYAPKIARIPVPPEKAGLVIGTGGRVIRAIQEETNSKIEIQEDGYAYISSQNYEDVERAKKMVEAILEEAEVGKIYEGRVVAIREFGAFVEILPGKEGLLHISELSDSFIRNIRDVLSEGDHVLVRCVGIEPDGKIRLSRRGLAEGENGAEGEGSVTEDSGEELHNSGRSRSSHHRRSSGSSNKGGGPPHKRRRRRSSHHNKS